MYRHSDPTATRALGSVQREWTRMVRLALCLKTCRPGEWRRAQEARFTGIYRRLLDETPEELRRMLAGREPDEAGPQGRAG